MISLALALALGGNMSIDAAYVSTWYGKPPLKRLDLDITAKNTSKSARWLFIPGTVGSESTGGVHGVVVYETPGWLWQIEGSMGGWAVKIPAGGTVTLKKLGVSSWFSD